MIHRTLSAAAPNRAAAIAERKAIFYFLAAEVFFLTLMAVAGPVLSLEFFPWWGGAG